MPVKINFTLYGLFKQNLIMSKSLGLLIFLVNFGLVACDKTNATQAPLTPAKPHISTPQATIQPAKKVKLYLIDFGIQFITGKHEEEIEQWDKTGCDLDLQAFKQTFDNDFSHTYTPKSYQKYDARGKFTIENRVYYFDSQGVLNPSFDGFQHINKQQLLQLWHDTCFKK